MAEQSHLLDLIVRQGVARKVLEADRHEGDRGLADMVRFPFLAIVGQTEMKMALLLTLVNPYIGGVLLIGPRGTAKTTAVRGLVDLMPMVPHSLCPEGCDEEAAQFGADAICTNCLEKFQAGLPLTSLQPMRLIELPLNSRLEDVIGGIDERKAVERNKLVITRGLLSYADKNLLYIDEVNMLDDAITDAILDAAAQGIYTVRRGPQAATYNSRLLLVGSMNPEEGGLRPQLQDRFGLRVIVRALETAEERLALYRVAVTYRQHPYKVMTEWRYETELAALDIQEARDILPQVTFAEGVELEGLRWIQTLGIESHRAEITLFEAARAYAALDKRTTATVDDLKAIAPLALRHRQSTFMETFFQAQQAEDAHIQKVIVG